MTLTVSCSEGLLRLVAGGRHVARPASTLPPGPPGGHELLLAGHVLLVIEGDPLAADLRTHLNRYKKII